MSKALDTINIPTNQKAATDQDQCTILKLIVNYIKGRNPYPKVSSKLASSLAQGGVLTQCGVLSPTLFNIYTAHCHHPKYRSRSCLMQMTSPLYLHTHARIQSRIKYIQPYLASCMLTADPVEYTSNLYLIINHYTAHDNAPKYSGS